MHNENKTQFPVLYQLHLGPHSHFISCNRKSIQCCWPGSQWRMQQAVS